MNKIAAIVPAFDEEHTIGLVVGELFTSGKADLKISRVVVVDNNSSDSTAQAAESAGALVVFEKREGYGSACLKGMEHVEGFDIVVFVDGDYCDNPSEWMELVKPITEDGYDLVTGSRIRGRAEPGALALQAKFGNTLAVFLMRLLYKSPFTDLGPFRAVRLKELKSLEMRDMDYGWTVEMQLKALRYGLRCKEVPVSYRKRLHGRSKVTGTVKGTLRAGGKILWLITLEFWGRFKKIWDSQKFPTQNQ